MRLIDADKLLDTEINMKYTDGKFYIESAEIYKLIDEQPTAYDVGKVVKELKKKIDHNRDWEDDGYFYGLICGYQNAIEIVKGGVK